MRAIITDDEKFSLGTLKKLLEIKCPSVNIVAECYSADEAIEKIQSLRPELVFLDIAMPGKSGLEMLAEIKTIDFQLIFVTAYDEYILQALHYSAVDYLLKPVEEDRLAEAVSKAEKKLGESRINNKIETLVYNLTQAANAATMKLCIPTLKGFQVVSLEEIICCEAEDSYTTFFLNSGTKICSAKTLLDYELLLRNTSFLRVHKSYLINLHHIKEYQRGDGGTVIMSNGTMIEVSRRKKELFLTRIKEVFKY
jgi:two-component system, LytTR family, response regulator